MIDEVVRRHGVDVVAGSSGRRATPVAYADIAPDGRATYRFDMEWDVPPLRSSLEASHLHVGSYSATVEPGASKVLATAQRMHSTATVSYDPNVRPALMSHEDRAKIEKLIGYSDVVKASDEDVEWLYGACSIDEVMRAWGARGVALAVVTCGGAGCRTLLAHEGRVHTTAAEVATVADTVGAGDSFMAGLISGLLDAGLLGGRQGAESLRRALWHHVEPAIARAGACAALTVRHNGAYAPSRSEVG
jgi:fructokinase